jgi:hypothetical protein
MPLFDRHRDQLRYLIRMQFEQATFQRSQAGGGGLDQQQLLAVSVPLPASGKSSGFRVTG